MIQRVTLVLSLLTIGGIIAGVLIVGTKLDRIADKLDERNVRTPAPPPPAAPPPAASPEPSAQDAERKKIRELAQQENQDQFAELARRLALEAELEAKLKAAFTEEFAYYTEGVVRALKNIEAGDQGGDENYLTSAAFRKGLEERITATDGKAHALLNAFQQSTFDDWRREMRRERYELD